MRFLFFFSFCFLEASDIVFYILFLFSVGRQHLLMDVAPLGAMTLIVPKYINMNLAPRAAAARSRPLSFPHKKTSILFMRRPSCPPLWYVTFDLGHCWRLSLTKETRQKLFPLSLMALYYFTAPKGYYVRTTTTFHSFLWACDFILAAFLSPNDTVSVVVPNGPYGTLWSGSFERSSQLSDRI